MTSAVVSESRLARRLDVAAATGVAAPVGA